MRTSNVPSVDPSVWPSNEGFPQFLRLSESAFQERFGHGADAQDVHFPV